MIVSMSERVWYTQRPPKIIKIVSFKRAREGPWRGHPINRMLLSYEPSKGVELRGL